jgi:hypothetical protein
MGKKADSDGTVVNAWHRLYFLFAMNLFFKPTHSVAYPGIFFGGEGVSTNSVEDRGQRERGSGGGSPLVRGSTQFSNE